MLVIMCKPNEDAYIAEINNDLESMQSIVNGYIETFYPFEDDVCIVCNDEGKIHGMPLCRAIYDGDELIDIIAGTFFICGCGCDEFTDVPDDLLEKYLKRFEDAEDFAFVEGKVVVNKAQ